MLPGQLDESLQKFVGHPQALPFEEIIPVSYTHVTGSLNDLIERLGKTGSLSPRKLASVSLATGLEPDTSFLGSKPVPPVAVSRTSCGRAEHHRGGLGGQCRRPRAPVEPARRPRRLARRADRPARKSGDSHGPDHPAAARCRSHVRTRRREGAGGPACPSRSETDRTGRPAPRKRSRTRSFLPSGPLREGHAARS